MTDEPNWTPRPERKYFARIDDDGNVLGFYLSDVGAPPPKEAIEITYAQWRQYLSGQGTGQAYHLIDGQLVPFTLPPKDS